MMPLPSATSEVDKTLLDPANSTTTDSPPIDVDHGVIVAGVVLGSAGFIFLSICAAVCVHFVGKKIRQRKHSTIKMRRSDHDRKQQQRIRQQQQQEGKDYVLYQNLPVPSNSVCLLCTSMGTNMNMKQILLYGLIRCIV